MTIATRLTIARMCLAAALGPVILLTNGVLPFVLLTLAAATDYFDGMLARARDEVTPLGTALDPIADKLVAVSALVAFSANGTLSGIHAIAALLILLREAFVSGLRESGSAGSLPVSRIAKWKTALQFGAFGLLCFGPSIPALTALWVAAALTVATGADYLRRWRPSG